MQVYLDNAATTRVRGDVLRVMESCYTDHFGNPSAAHGFGRDASRALSSARAQISKQLHADSPEEILFTSGGTESDHLALRSVLSREKRAHVITSAVEHHAVLRTLQFYEQLGLVRTTILPVDPSGIVDPASVSTAICSDTSLVSVMAVNNETGVIQPITEIGRICRDNGVLFHTDAVQAASHLDPDLSELPVDLLSLSAHKFHGPKGAGLLYVRRGLKILPLFFGGDQEKSRRAGTENVPAIVGMAEALRLADAERAEVTLRTAGLRDLLVEGIFDACPRARLNGHPKNRISGIANICFPGIPAEQLLAILDLNGIAASAGAACTAGSLEPSHVLLAMGCSTEDARCSLRFSLSGETTEEEILYTVKVLRDVLTKYQR